MIAATRWGKLAELRPDRIEEIVAAYPVAFLPLGLLEHHGWHLPIGLDGLKSESICMRVAERTGGLVLPVMWWGGGGGHGDFKWTFYQDEESAFRVVDATARKLFACGIEALILFAGHYPWEWGLDEHGVLGGLRKDFPGKLVLCGSEVTITPEAAIPPGDHASRQETDYGLALFPSLIDIDALTPGRTVARSWPGGVTPEPDARFPGVDLDPASPRFAQLGEDPRQASATEGEANISALVAALTSRIQAHLAN